MHDGLELETRGLPAAVLCTEPFQSTAAAICQVRGIPDYRFVLVEHPIGSLSEEELRARADAAIAGVTEILGAVEG